MNRTRAREQAFILLFSRRFQPDALPWLLETCLAETDPGDQAGYIREVTEGAAAHAEELDARIGEYAKAWSTDRISRVCMAAMELAVYEMQYMDSIPLNVSVNEAVNLAKRYDGDESVAFVNGVLGNLKERLAGRAGKEDA